MIINFDLQGQKISRKGTHPAGKVSHPALVSTRPFSVQFILKVSKQRFLPSDFGRLLRVNGRFSVWYK